MATKEDIDMEDKIESWRGILKEINDQFESRLDENVYEGVHDEKIYHGLKLTSSTQTLPKDFIDMCYCTKTKEYLLLDKGVEVQRYTLQGKPLQPSYRLPPTMTFEEIKWIPEQSLIVGFDPMDDSAWILSTSFTSLQSFRCDFFIKGLFYEPKRNEIVAVGTTHSALMRMLRDQKEYLFNLRRIPQYKTYALFKKRYLVDLEKDTELEAVTKALTYTDPEFGPTWQLDSAALIPETSSNPTLLAATYLTTLYLMPVLIDEEDDDMDGSMECLKKQAYASKAASTTLHYHESSTWIIIGDQQGNVSAWSLSLQCMMSVTGAHEERVRMIAPHSSICGFLTYSIGAENRSKLQVWSCNVRDKTEDFTDFGPIKAIVPNEAAAVVAVLASKIYFLTMHQVYNFFAPLSMKAKYLTSTSNPMYQKKVVVASEDNTVRVFSSFGKQLNAQLLPKESLQVVAATFSGNKKELFTIILKTGEILVSDYTTCPMKFRSVFVNDGPVITCLIVYEYFDEIRDSDRFTQKPRIFYPINVRLIVGTEIGQLVVINVDTGKREYTCPAHNDSVTQLQTAINTQRIISLGIDSCVKVWRVFADLNEPLAVYYTLYFIIPITRIKSMGYVLCMANSSPTSKVHQVLMENMTERIRLQHPPSKDHTHQILDMATSDTLGICATSSLDYTIRIWDDQNTLLKILEINACSKLVTFSSFRGDLAFSAGRHLYQIPYKNYLPPKYRAKIVAKDIPKEEKEAPIPENVEYKIYENIIDRNELLYPYNNTPLLSLDMSSPDTPKVAVLIQKQICALLKDRDEDIAKIKDNLVEPTKLSGNRSLMNKLDWDKYVSDLISSMTRVPPEVPEYDYSKILEENPKEKFYNKFGVFKMIYGYDVKELEEPENLRELTKGARLPLHGFLPNSVIYQSTEDEVSVASEEEIPKKVFRYRYPAEFYPEEEEEEEEERRVSIRLSQLMMGGGGGGDDDEQVTEE